MGAGVIQALRLFLRFALRMAGVTLCVYGILYLTPGTLRVRIVDVGPESEVERRSGRSHPAEVDMTLIDSDCLRAGPTGATLSYNAELDRQVRVEAGERHCVGGMLAVPGGYLRWLSKAAQGDLGYYYGTPVVERLRSDAGRTLLLVAGALLVSLTLALALIAVEAWRPRNPWVGYGVQTFTAFSGLHVIVLCFATIGMQWALPNRGFSLWLIVILAIGNGTLADYYAILREQVAGATRQDYVQAARGRGASPLVHALRNEMLLGLLSATSSRVPALIGGTIVIEWVFSYLGLGYDIIKAIQDRHFELIMGVTTAIAAVLVGVLEASALARRSLDPRIGGPA